MLLGLFLLPVEKTHRLVASLQNWQRRKMSRYRRRNAAAVIFASEAPVWYPAGLSIYKFYRFSTHWIIQLLLCRHRGAECAWQASVFHVQRVIHWRYISTETVKWPQNSASFDLIHLWHYKKKNKTVVWHNEGQVRAVSLMPHNTDS